MNATKHRVGSRPRLVDAANVLTTGIRADGRHDYVTVRTERGFLYVDVNEEPIARVEPLSSGQYGLSFHHHTGRWEPTPFTASHASSQRSAGSTWILTTFHPRRADRTTSFAGGRLSPRRSGLSGGFPAGSRRVHVTFSTASVPMCDASL